MAAEGPDGSLQFEPGDVVVALTQAVATSAITDGSIIETDDENGRFEILARSEWAAGWTRLSLRCVA